jgi:hypothetical protein
MSTTFFKTRVFFESRNSLRPKLFGNLKGVFEVASEGTKLSGLRSSRSIDPLDWKAIKIAQLQEERRQRTKSFTLSELAASLKQ